ncbi:MAG: beta-phosphoglucomutase family hydrolase [Elusimicrobiota bacterium]|jgi:beta-phosphoglucomutase family hydrolase
MAPPRALLFDLDGVVVDNMAVHAEAWRLFLRGHGLRIGMKEFHEKTAGMPTRDVLVYYLKRRFTKAEVERLTAEKEAVYQRLYRPLMRPARGLRRFLSAARKIGLRLGVGTGSRAESAAFVLDGLRLRSCFDAVVTVDDIRRGKPHPETFLTLARRLGVPPRSCLVFEDSLLGAEAARRAGMGLVALTTSHPPRSFLHALHAVPHFASMDPAKLV